METGKTNVLILCRANVNRSPIAGQIFSDKLKAMKLGNYCNISTAGMKHVPYQVFEDSLSFMDEALVRRGYHRIENHAPAVLKSGDVPREDIIFTLDRRVDELLRWKWADEPEKLDKLKFLPEYGLQKKDATSIAQSIFDPQSIFVTPMDNFSEGLPQKKLAAMRFLRLFKGDWAALMVYRTTGYVPLRSDSLLWKESVPLYERTIMELEPCIDGAITRMQKDGLLPQNRID